ncbi:WD domain, G-beta repeat protein [Ancylostoma ceylanicum]|uniref:WD domain, G-beta repeat protein n=1 Tax=Ancylostoma ceylanicum TaxID=53326 RepID=A0A0D6LZA0_9BILA|nr:WD domain, G-beta repeat protein [Ancylostoma ceylanicum]
MLDEDEEELLAKKLFGDNHVVLEESSDDEDTVIEQLFFSSVLRPKHLEKQKTKRKADDSDDEVDDVLDEMTRSAQRYVDKDPFLVKDIVSTFRWPDITVGHHDTRPINVVLFHNVRPVVLTAGSSGKVQLFRVGDRSDSGNFLQNIQFSNFPVTSMSLMQGGCSVICGSIRQDYLMKYDLEKGSVMQLYLPKCIPRQNAGRFTVSYDGSLLAMIAHSSQVHVLSSSSMELVKTLSAPTDVTSLQFLPGSSRELWAMTERGEVVIWSLQGSQHVFRDEGAVRGTKIRLSPDGSKVACGSNTGIVNVYDVADVRKSTDPKPSTVASNLVTSCDSIAFNHDSQVMAFSSNVKKNQIKLLHVASSTVFNNFPKKHEKMTNIECAEFSPHSAYLGIGCSNGQLILERLNHFEDY